MPGALDEHARARVGAVINKKYRLGRLIGSGGMASVYEAVHRNANRVASKMLHPHLSIDADLRARFLREGYVANTVDHRGAVRVLDDDMTEDGAVFLVMELLEGETLDARCERAGGRLPAREVCTLAHQLLEVLAAAHAKGIVHRDIKPENLFLTSEGFLKVLDFGIARLREASGPEGVTRTGRTMGTPAFMPPEQVLGRARDIDGKTDLYAVGATMFALVSGRFVHEAETMEEMLVREGSQPARAVVSVSRELPGGIAGVIDRALAFDKQGRWSDAQAMAEALGEAYRTAYGSPLPSFRASRLPSEPPALSQPVLAHRDAPGTDDPSQARGAVAPTAPAHPVGSGTELAESWPTSHPAAKRVSTTSGLAGVATVERTSGVPSARRRTGMWIAIGTIPAMAVGAGVLLVARNIPREPESAAPAFTTTASVTAVSAQATASARVAPAPQPVTPATSDAQTRTVDVSMLPTAAATPRPVAPRAPAPVVRSTVLDSPIPVLSPAPARVASTVTATAAAPTPSCRIETKYDSDGQPHFKKVCN